MSLWMIAIIFYYLLLFCPPRVTEAIQQVNSLHFLLELKKESVNFFSTTDFSNYARLYLMQ